MRRQRNVAAGRWHWPRTTHPAERADRRGPVRGCLRSSWPRLGIAEHADDATINDVVLAMCGARYAYLISRGALPGAPLIARRWFLQSDTAVIDVFGQGPGNKIGTLMLAGDAIPASPSNGSSATWQMRDGKAATPAEAETRCCYERIGRQPAALDGPCARAAAPTNVTISNAGRAVLERRSPGRVTCSRHFADGGVEHHL